MAEDRPFPTEEATVEGQTVKVTVHPQFDSEYVYEVPSVLFDKFCANRDAVMVMFYNSDIPQKRWGRDAHVQAAKATKRDNHAYIAVNCVDQKQLCDKEKITYWPTFKLYTRGKYVATYNDLIRASDLKKFVETAPLLEAWKRPNVPCGKPKEPTAG